MKTNNEKNWTAADWHPKDEDLLMSLDGELEGKEAQAVRSHLDCCWSCRSRSERLQGGISAFIDYHEAVLTPMVKSSPNSWTDFNNRLQKAVSESEKSVSWFRLLVNHFNLFWQNFNRVLAIRTATASLLVVAILVAFLFFGREQKVSASELLDKATASQNEKLNSTAQPVIYQKLRVRAENKQTMDWEVWNDAKNARSKQTISGEQPKESVDILQELSEILQKNKMSSTKPLSAESFKSWHSSLAEKTDEITENEVVTLKTINRNATFDGQISEAIVKFRQNDFHPFEQILKVKTANGEKTFEIAEVNFEVVSLKTLKPNFFDETPTSTEIVKVTKTETSPTPQPSESPTVSPSPSVESSPEVLPKPIAESKTPKVENSPKITATADLEVEVLQLLNNAKADLGEEITVKRENGILYVRGLVENTERKNEILTSLQSVRQNPAVRIELNTVAEAVAKQKNQPTRTPNKIEDYKTETLTTAAENDLVEHFGNEAGAKRFASNTVRRSSQAINYVYAMRRLSRQFSAAELKNLSPEAKSKWLGLIASYARNFKAESEGLSRELGSVFNAPKVSGSANVAVNSLDDLPRAIETLVTLASSNDRIIRSALTISAGDAQFSALKATQFWQSLKNAEALATKIAAMK